VSRYVIGPDVALRLAHDRAVIPGQQPEGQPAVDPDLVEPEGVNAGSARAERDRRPSGDATPTPRRGDPQTTAPPIEEGVGLPGQRADVPGQQLGDPT